jgi:hypothetical protein
MRKGLGGWLFAGLLVGVVGALLIGWMMFSQVPRRTLASAVRSLERYRTLTGLARFERRQSAHFDLYFNTADEAVADMVLQTAETVWDPVIQRMGRRPSGRVPLILYPSREELRQAFGWGQSESALGVYWQGTIRLLSPNVWLEGLEEESREKAFARLNPIAHEFTHYLLDELTAGNYPRWFTEALAQRVEAAVTGYVWLESSSRLSQTLYSYEELVSHFHKLPNQSLAYREAYLFLDWLTKERGEPSLERLVHLLAKGDTFEGAFTQAFEAAPAERFQEWSTWVQANAAELDAAISP